MRLSLLPALGLLALCPAIPNARGGDGGADWGKEKAASPPELSLHLALPKDRFFQGEVIPARLTFRNDSRLAYTILDAKTQQGPGLAGVFFSATNASWKTVPDLPSWYYARGADFLSKGRHPGWPVALSEWDVEVVVNGWIYFPAPGTYLLTARSDRISRESFPDTPVPVVSNTVTLHIEPRSAEQERDVIERSAAKLRAFRNIPLVTTPGSVWPDDREAQTAIQELSYLQTPAAFAVIIPYLEQYDQIGIAATQALERSVTPRQTADQLLEGMSQGQPLPNTAAFRVYAALETFEIPGGFLFGRTLMGNPFPIEKAVREAGQKFLTTVKTSTGGQGPIYAEAVLTELFNDYGNPELRKELIPRQLELSLRARKEVIGLWESELMNPTGRVFPDIGGPEFIPLVRQTASAPDDDVEALKLLARVSPEDARPLIIADIQRPVSSYLEKPRIHYSWPTGLNALPATPIPELTGRFREMLAQSDWKNEHLLPLVERYGTRDLLPEVKRFYRAEAGNWPCVIETACLRYLLRHDPTYGVAALKASLASRKKTACYKQLLGEVFDDFWVPSALPLVEATLNDPDPEAVLSAGEVLLKHGSKQNLTALTAVLERIRQQFPDDGGVMHQSNNLAKSLLASGRWSPGSSTRSRLEEMAAQKKPQVFDLGMGRRK